MGKKYSFSYPYASYMDVSLMRETHTRKELLQEYKAMRDEVNKRLKRLEKFQWMQESNVYQMNKDRFIGGVSKLNKTELARKMREAAIFIGAQTSTVEGQRQRRDRMLETFREEWGLSFLNRRNINEFVRFLAAARAHYGAAYYSMSDIEALYRTAKQGDLSISQIEKNFSDFAEKAYENPNYAKYMREAEQRFSSGDYEG